PAGLLRGSHRTAAVRHCGDGPEAANTTGTGEESRPCQRARHALHEAESRRDDTNAFRLSQDHPSPGRQSLRRIDQFVHRRRYYLRQRSSAGRATHERAAEAHERHSAEPAGRLEFGEGDKVNTIDEAVATTVKHIGTCT